MASANYSVGGKPLAAGITDIPENLLVEIFHHLPVVDICRIRRVCHCWNRVAKDRSLWRYVDMTDNRLVISRVWKILRPNMASIVSLKVGGPIEIQRRSIERNKFTDAMMKDLGKHCPRLTALCIQGADLRNVFASSLPQSLHSLQILCTVLPANWINRLNTKAFTNLKQLSLQESSRIHNAEVENICKVFPNLQLLDLSYCYRVTDGLESVAKHLLDLEYLDISGTGFYHESENVFQQGVNRLFHQISRGLTKLRVLKACRIDMLDLNVASIIGLKNLEVLHVDSCHRLTDFALSHLDSAKTLRLLSVKMCKGLSKEGIESFKERNPNCEVIH